VSVAFSCRRARSRSVLLPADRNRGRAVAPLPGWLWIDSRCFGCAPRSATEERMDQGSGMCPHHRNRHTA
jgi:hypothetical protein